MAVATQTTESKHKPYPAYKPSGVEWLGDIPAHWAAKRLKHLCTRSALYGVNESAASYSSEGVRFLRTTDISDDGELTTDNAVFLERSLVDEYLLQDGDLLISRSGTLGRSFVYNSKLHGECSYAGYLVRYVPAQSLVPRFAFYFTKTSHFQQWLSLVVISSTIGNINGQKYANMHLPVPPVPEQRAIAAFLDRETTRLDALIAKKQRLIELLQEKRTALISQAVTKGLDPNVAMKDSGVEWLGKIPAHWKVSKLKRLVPAITVGIVVTPAKYYVDSGVPCPRSLNISSGKITENGMVYISPESNELHKKSKIFADDVVIVRTGQTGTAAIVTAEYDGANCIDLLIVRRSMQLVSKWLYYFFNSPAASRQIEAYSVGAIQSHYNTSTVAELVVPKLSTDEQAKIVAYLDGATTKIDDLVGKVNDAIQRLREYRTALIAAVVTGKMEVVSPNNLESTNGVGG